MKAEGSSIVNTVLHKVKVKEEKKECNYQQQGSPSSSPSTTTTTTEHSIPTTINTITTSPTSTTTTTSTSLTTKDSSTINSLNSSVICQISTSSTSSTSSENSIEPVDLDIKKKGVSNHNQLDNDNQDLIIKDNILSPSSQKIKLQQIICVNNERDYLRGQQSSSGSSGNESPTSSHSIKHDNDEFTISKHDDTAISHLSSNTESKTGNNIILNESVRCIASVFSGHAKLKRLLGTLVQFANNISIEIGDTVRTLVLGLLSGGITAEEFHSALQEATNFPLRDFVLPYLRHTIPSLKRNLNAAARANNQTCVQFLRSNESAILETVSLAPSGETVELFGDHNTNGNSNTSTYNASRSGTNTIQHLNPASIHHHYSGATNLATKRRISDTPYYDNNGGLDDTPIYGKRANNPWNHHAHQQHQQSDIYCWYQPAHSSSTTSSIQNHSQSHGQQVPPNLVQINQLSSFGAPQPQPLPSSQQQSQSQSQSQQQQQQQQQQQHQHSGQITGQNGLTLDDEWKNIHVMLNCILGMVEKTKRALVILQRRGCSSPAATQSCTQNGNNITTANGSQIDSSVTTDRDNNLKRLSGEIVAQTIRATEDRVAAEVKRRAEDAVQEVKRVAMIEVQRAISSAVAESRVSERLRVHQLLDLPTSHRAHGPLRQGFMRIGNHLNKNDNTSKTTSAATSSLTCDDEKDNTHNTTTSVIGGTNCWNCGRPALETCGGCGIARYCGSFCQHRDWEAGGHHANCHSNINQDTRRSSSQSPPRIGSSVLGSSTDVDSGPTKGK